MFIHLTAAVSNEATTYLGGAYLFWLLGGVATGPPTMRGLVHLVLAGLAMPLLTKLSVLPMALTVLVAACVQAFVLWRDQRAWLLAGLSLGALAIAALLFGIAALNSDLWNSLLFRVFGTRNADSLALSIAWLIRSYWGLFGGFTHIRELVEQRPGGDTTSNVLSSYEAGDVALPGFVALALTGLCIVGALLCLCFLQSRSARAAWHAEQPGLEQPGQRVWWLVWLSVGLSLAIVLKNVLATSNGAQGRFLFPTAGAISLVVTTGWLSALPARASRALPWTLLSILVALNLFVCLGRL